MPGRQADDSISTQTPKNWFHAIPLLKTRTWFTDMDLSSFLIVSFLLKKLAWPVIIKGLRDREKGIADSLATAERVRAEMAQLKNENEALLALAREERSKPWRKPEETKDKIISDAKRTGESWSQ